MVKIFKEAEIKKMLGYVTAEQMSFSRMVELINERSNNHAKESAREALKNANARLTHHYFVLHDDKAISRGIFEQIIENENNIPI